MEVSRLVNIRIPNSATEIKTDICMLHDAQKLMGDLQWLRPVVGISNDDLDTLRPLLQGVDPAKSVHLSPQQEVILQRITEQVTKVGLIDVTQMFLWI